MPESNRRNESQVRVPAYVLAAIVGFFFFLCSGLGTGRDSGGVELDRAIEDPLLAAIFGVMIPITLALLEKPIYEAVPGIRTPRRAALQANVVYVGLVAAAMTLTRAMPSALGSRPAPALAAAVVLVSIKGLVLARHAPRQDEEHAIEAVTNRIGHAIVASMFSFAIFFSALLTLPIVEGAFFTYERVWDHLWWYIGLKCMALVVSAGGVVVIVQSFWPTRRSGKMGSNATPHHPAEPAKEMKNDETAR